MARSTKLNLGGNGRAHFASLTVNSLYVGFGAMMGYVSPAIPNLNANHNAFHVDLIQQSWIGSIVYLGAAVGGLLSGPMSDYLGRKLTMILTGLFTVVGLTIVASSTTVMTMYVGMFISGLWANCNGMAVLYYASEIAPSDLRGFMMCSFNVFWAIGNLFVYMVGAVIPWNWLAIAVAAVYVAPLIPLLFCAESPRWFLLIENKPAAEFSLKWFRGSRMDIDVDEEIRVVENSLRYVSKGIKAYVDLLEFKNLKPLLICLFLLATQQFCGSELLQAFSVTLFQDAGVQIDAYVQTIIIGLLAVLGSIASVLVIEQWGRRTTLIVSATTMAVSMVATGVFFKVQDIDPVFAIQYLFWLPIVSFSISNFAFYFGLNPVVWIYSCELFPTNVRASAGSVISLAYGILAFFAIETYVYIQDALTIAGMFWLYAGICALGAVVTITVVPHDAHVILD